MEQEPHPEIPLKSIEGLPMYDHVNDNSPSNPPKASIPSDRETRSNEYFPLYIDQTIADEPHALYRLIRQQAQLPPRILLSVKVRKSKEDATTEFNFILDLTPTVFRNDSTDSEWNEFKVLRDGDGVEAYRGGCTTSLRWKHGSRLRGLREQLDLENGNGEIEIQNLLGMNETGSNEEASALMAWCERFCRDPAGIKTFIFRRQVVGFDIAALQSEVLWFLRSMNYLKDGRYIVVSTSIHNPSFLVASPHWCNFMRKVGPFFAAVMVVTQLWIFAFLFRYLNSRYEVVHSAWHSSRKVKDSTVPCGYKNVYAHGRDEAKLVDLWSPAIIQALKDRENSGRILRFEYLERLQERTQERIAHVESFKAKQNEAQSSMNGNEQAGPVNATGKSSENVNAADS